MLREMETALSPTFEQEGKCRERNADGEEQGLGRFKIKNPCRDKEEWREENQAEDDTEGEFVVDEHGDLCLKLTEINAC